MSTANSHDIKVIGVVQRGNINISQIVRKYAVDIVRWDTDSIVNAIRRYRK